MATNERTPEQAKADYIEVMGEKLGSIYHALWQRFAWLTTTWEQYVDLYGERESRIELLNKAAPLFFGVAQVIFWEDTLLSIARLTGPTHAKRSKSDGGPRLTVRLLPGLVKQEAKRDVGRAVAAAVEASAFCEDWRNKRIAHLELEHALDPIAEPIADASRAQVHTALGAIKDVLDAVTLGYDNSTSYFGLKSYGGGEALLHVLHDGVKRHEEKCSRFANGTATPDDWKPPDI